MVVNELIDAIIQVVFFAAIPFIVWLIFGRKKEGFGARIPRIPARALEGKVVR